MAGLSDLKRSYRFYMRAYRYRRFDWGAGARLGKSLAECRVAAITTAAFHAPHQEPFDEDFKGGDFSYRTIERGSDLAALEMSHKSDAFDASGIEADRNLALPLDRLQELAAEGRIGSVGPRHFSFMGSIPAPGRLLAQSAPEVARALLEDQVDAVVLTPV